MHREEIEAFTLSGLSISWCFTGSEIIQPPDFSEEHSSLATSAREARGKQNAEAGGAGSEEERFSDSLSAACQASRTAGDEWVY